MHYRPNHSITTKTSSPTKMYCTQEEREGNTNIKKQASTILPWAWIHHYLLDEVVEHHLVLDKAC